MVSKKRVMRWQFGGWRRKRSGRGVQYASILLNSEKDVWLSAADAVSDSATLAGTSLLAMAPVLVLFLDCFPLPCRETIVAFRSL